MKSHLQIILPKALILIMMLSFFTFNLNKSKEVHKRASTRKRTFKT